jgi:hypothetical protein
VRRFASACERTSSKNFQSAGVRQAVETISAAVLRWSLTHLGGSSVEYHQRYGAICNRANECSDICNPHEEGMMKAVAFRMGLWFSVGCSLLLIQ